MFPITLPSGKTVSFKAPTFQDRRNILREYDRKDGYLPEDLLAAKCLTHVDGSPVEEDWVADIITRFDNWDLKDQAFYLEVYMNMFSLDEKVKQAAADQAKKLMGSTQPTEKTKAVKVVSGNLAA